MTTHSLPSILRSGNAAGQALIVTLALTSTLIGACIQGSPDQLQDRDRILARRVGTERPSPQHVLDVRFDESVELIGYDIEPEEPSAGQTVRITWYWHCLRPPGEGYQIFTHLVDAETGLMCAGCNFDTASVDNLRRIHPPGRWEAGTYIRDVQRIRLPDRFNFSTAEFRIGIFRGAERMPITRGPHDGERRARGPRFDTGYRPPPVSALVVPRASGAIEIDGRLDDDAWEAAPATPPFRNATDGRSAGPRTTAKLLYDDQNLYVAFQCADDHIYSTFTRHDEHLWRQDAVEVFIDPPGRGRDYYEVQVSPTGQTFDTKIHHHPDRDDGWESHLRAAATRRGTLNDDEDRDEGWTAELAIPLASLVHELPRPGTTWRVGLFRLDTRRNGRRAFLAWSPPLANTTHVPRRFGRLTFGSRPEESPTGPGSEASDGGATMAEARADGAPGESPGRTEAGIERRATRADEVRPGEDRPRRGDEDRPRRGAREDMGERGSHQGAEARGRRGALETSRPSTEETP